MLSRKVSEKLYDTIHEILIDPTVNCVRWDVLEDNKIRLTTSIDGIHEAGFYIINTELNCHYQWPIYEYKLLEEMSIKLKKIVTDERVEDFDIINITPLLAKFRVTWHTCEVEFDILRHIHKRDGIVRDDIRLCMESYETYHDFLFNNSVDFDNILSYEKIIRLFKKPILAQSKYFNLIIEWVDYSTEILCINNIFSSHLHDRRFLLMYVREQCLAAPISLPLDIDIR